MQEETREAGITGTRTAVDTEAEDGEETGVGEGTSVGSNSGMTETETGTGVMEVGISQVLRAPTRDTTPIIIDHIMTDTDLPCNLSGVVSIYSIHSLLTCIAVPQVAICNCFFFFLPQCRKQELSSMPMLRIYCPSL